MEFLYFYQFDKVLLFWLSGGETREQQFFIKTSNFHLRLIFLIFSSKYWKLGYFLPLKVCSTSCLIRQNQNFFKSNVFWDIEKLQCKSELGCSDKIRSHKKTLVASLRNMTWRLKKIHVIFIIPVGYSWLVKLVRSFITRKTV